MRRVLLFLVAAACAAAVPGLAAPPARPGLWGRYLLGYSSCVAPAVACQEELAQSRDGIRWAPVIGFSPRTTLAPDCCRAIRRGSRLLLYDGLSLRRFAVSARTVSELAPAALTLDSTAPPEWTDVVVDASGGLVLVYAVPAETGGLAVRTATDRDGGTTFVTDRGDRAVLDAGSGPASFFRGRGGWTGLLADGECLRVLTAGNLRGTYRDGGCLVTPSPVTAPSGYRNARLGETWLYGTTGTGISRALALTLAKPLAASRFRPLEGLSQGRTIGSLRFSSAQP